MIARPALAAVTTPWKRECAGLWSRTLRGVLLTVADSHSGHGYDCHADEGGFRYMDGRRMVRRTWHGWAETAKDARADCDAHAWRADGPANTLGAPLDLVTPDPKVIRSLRAAE